MTTSHRPAHRRPNIALAVLAIAALALASHTSATKQDMDDLPRSALAVDTGRGWRVWWRSGNAPPTWRATDDILARGLRWSDVAPGLELAELRLAGSGEAWRMRLVVVRVDTDLIDLRLRRPINRTGSPGAWAVDSLSSGALLGINAGQFDGRTPWGWIVVAGRELQPPGTGPLSMAIVVDTAARVALLSAADIEPARAAAMPVMAFQSYPMLLDDDGVVPVQLRAHGRGVDLGHRDSRLAIGELRDGRLLIVLTRFEALGGILSELPFGPTIPELAAIMGALGCRRAVALDGGISGQLVLRFASGELRAWHGLRRVPLALEAFAR